MGITFRDVLPKNKRDLSFGSAGGRRSLGEPQRAPWLCAGVSRRWPHQGDGRVPLAMSRRRQCGRAAMLQSMAPGMTSDSSRRGSFFLERENVNKPRLRGGWLLVGAARLALRGRLASRAAPMADRLRPTFRETEEHRKDPRRTSLFLCGCEVVCGNADIVA